MAKWREMLALLCLDCPTIPGQISVSWDDAVALPATEHTQRMTCKSLSLFVPPNKYCFLQKGLCFLSGFSNLLQCHSKCPLVVLLFAVSLFYHISSFWLPAFAQFLPHPHYLLPKTSPRNAPTFPLTSVPQGFPFLP